MAQLQYLSTLAKEIKYFATVFAQLLLKPARVQSNNYVLIIRFQYSIKLSLL